MSAPLIKGWCPGAHRPMKSGDGLVVRVRPPGGMLSPAQAADIADLAETYSDGEVALTNRANLQFRRVAEDAWPKLLSRLSSLGLVPADAKTEGRLNIVVDPFRKGTSDTGPRIAEALTEGLAAPDFDSLPSKFGFVVDPGQVRRLSDISGDVRIEASRGTLIVRADGLLGGQPASSTDEAAKLALELTRWFLKTGGVGEDGRGRMARHVAAIGSKARLEQATPNPVAPHPMPGIAHEGLLVGAAFGNLSVNSLRALAASGIPEIRITPWRMVFLPGMVSADHFSQLDDLILDPADPRRYVDACPGAPGCPQATVATRDLARRLAPRLAPGTRAHVSGCAKGCAHPSPATLTFVGRDGRFDLVRAGAPWDAPEVCGMTAPQVLALSGN